MSSPSAETTSESLLRQAEEHYRQERFGEAMAAYEQALALDSSLSTAYYGHAKSAVRFHGLNTATLWQEWMQSVADGNLTALLAHPDSVLTHRLQASGRVRRMLGLLADRDTLTSWYAYLTEDPPSADALKDTLYAQRRAFIADYLVKADQGIPGHRPAGAFPLSDFKIRASSVATEHVMYQMLYSITRLHDLDRNDTIDARDSIMKRLSGLPALSPLDSLSGGDSTFADSLQHIPDDLLCNLLGSLCSDGAAGR